MIGELLAGVNGVIDVNSGGFCGIFGKEILDGGKLLLWHGE